MVKFLSEVSIDEILMQRCLHLASNGLGRVRPNPLVGCVVVRNGEIISEGYHQKYGEYHAERNALLRLIENGLSAAGSTLYVNLEPCSHYGKTPPCADLIVDCGVKKVVCCNDDPNPQVNGGGFDKLQQAGIEVVRHVLEPQGRFLNRRFFTFMEQKRPYVILKWAQTKDGFMDVERKNNMPCNYWISNPTATRLSHKWRTEESAILVGSHTVINDDPALTARLWKGNNPVRVVWGKDFKMLRQEFKVLDSQAPTILYDKGESIAEMLQDLYQRKIQSLIVEGGRQVLMSFLESGLWDEIRQVKSSTEFHKGLEAPYVELSPAETYELDDNLLNIYYK